MRRFSQRNSLVTLNDINITPLLDLAFVLLIIFVITRPALENHLKLDLPAGGRPLERPNPRDIRTVEVNPKQGYLLDRHPMSLEQIDGQLRRAFKANPNLIVYIRADENGRNKEVYAVIDRCQQIGISRFSLATAKPHTP